MFSQLEFVPAVFIKALYNHDYVARYKQTENRACTIFFVLKQKFFSTFYLKSLNSQDILEHYFAYMSQFCPMYSNTKGIEKNKSHYRNLYRQENKLV